MKFAYYDIECYQDLFMVVFKIEDQYHNFIYHKTINESERDALRDFYNNLKKTHMIVGFNSWGYDNCMLESFLDAKELRTLDTMRAVNDTIIDKKVDIGGANHVKGNHFIDVMALLAQKASLKTLQARRFFPTTKEVSIPFDQPTTTEEEVQSILKYCQNDVDSTEFIFKSDEAQAGFNSRTELGKKYKLPKNSLYLRSTTALGCDVVHEIAYPDFKGNRSKSGVTVESNKDISCFFKDIIDERIVFQTEEMNQFLQKLKDMPEYTYVSSKNSDEAAQTKHAQIKNQSERAILFGDLKINFAFGGLHGFNKNNEVEYHTKDVVDIDVSSMYPSIIDKFKLETTADGLNLSEAMREAIDLRDKSQSKGERDSYKLLVNAVYGNLRSPSSIFYSPKMAMAVNFNGQLVMLQLIEKLHLLGYRIIQVNTDGFTVVCPPEKKSNMIKEIEIWENFWELYLTKDDYDLWLQPNVNAVYAKSKEGKLKATNQFKPIKTRECHSFPKQPLVVYQLLVEKILEGTMTPSRYEKKDFMVVAPAKKGLFKMALPDTYKTFKNGKQSVISWKVDPSVVVNSHVNRCYYQKDVKHRLVVEREDGSLHKKFDGVAVLNDGFDLVNIDYNRYIELAEKEYAKVNANFVPTGNHEISVEDHLVENIDMKHINYLGEQKGIMSKLATRGECPNCADSRQFEKFHSNFHCHNCKYNLQLWEVEAMPDDTTPVEASVEPVEASVEPVEVTKPQDSTIDPMNIPDVVFSGGVGELVDARGERTIQHLSGAIGIVSSLTQTRGYVRYSKNRVKLKPAMYLALVLNTNSNKSGFTGMVSEALRPIDGVKVINTTESGQALITATISVREIDTGEKDKDGKAEKEYEITPYPTTFIYDELGRLFKSMNITNSTLQDDLLTGYDIVGPFTRAAQGFSKFFKGSMKVDVEIPSLDITVFGGMTVDTFTETLLDPSIIQAGLTNRFLVFHTTARQKFSGMYVGKGEREWEPAMVAVTKKIATNGIRLDGGKMFPEYIPENLKDYLMEKTLYGEFARIFEEVDSPKETNRGSVIFVRLLLMYMIADGREMINQNDIDAVDWIMRFYMQSMEELMSVENQRAVGNQYSKRKSIIQKKLEIAMDNNPEGLIQRDINRALRGIDDLNSDEINGVAASIGIVRKLKHGRNGKDYWVYQYDIGQNIK